MWEQFNCDVLWQKDEDCGNSLIVMYCGTKMRTVRIALL